MESNTAMRVQEVHRSHPGHLRQIWWSRARPRRPLPDHEGPEKFHRFVVVEFDSLERGIACFQSPEYEEAAAFRRNGAGEVETVIVEGGDATPSS
jgi:hypothetical protein